MRWAMRKTQQLPFKIFAAQLTELNNYLPLFPGSSNTNKMYTEEFNNILLHAVPNGWAKQSYTCSAKLCDKTDSFVGLYEMYICVILHPL